MEKFLLGLLDFVKEEDGGNSSRRLIFMFGAFVAIPVSYYFAYMYPESFDIIHSSNLWFLGALGGLTTSSNIIKRFTKK